jgi:hypothetical protein
LAAAVGAIGQVDYVRSIETLDDLLHSSSLAGDSS